MAAIHLPVTLEPLLPFARTSKQKKSNACFDSYAHLVTFAAALGFSELDGGPPSPGAPRSTLIEPIPWEYFSGGRQEIALHLIGLAAGGGTEIVNDAERLCRVIEDLAAEGGKALMKILRHGGDGSFHAELGELLIKAAKETNPSAVAI